MKIFIILFLLNIQLFARNVNMKKYAVGYSKYNAIIQANCQKYDLPKLLVCALISFENHNWDPKAVGIFGNGLMQVKGGSFEPGKNINQGCGILRRYIDYFKPKNQKDNIKYILIGLTAYQRGCTGAKRYGKISKYALDILDFWIILEKYQLKKYKIGEEKNENSLLNKQKSQK